jgi:hypothetical protein
MTSVVYTEYIWVKLLSANLRILVVYTAAKSQKGLPCNFREIIFAILGKKSACFQAVFFDSRYNKTH